MLMFKSLIFGFEVQSPKIYQGQNVSGWLMSEKLDGIRGYWDGKKLYTKNQKEIFAPEWFTKSFPPFPLDGELYTKRNDFENIQSIVLDIVPSEKWDSITYNIFEVPSQNEDFKNRLEKAKEWFGKYPTKHVKIIEQLVCKDEKDLNDFLSRVVNLKGEGVIVKDGSKEYNIGRSNFVLKVKTFYDMEGELVGYNYEKNVFKSFKLKLENGIMFDLGGGIDLAMKKNLPKIGEKITFKFYGFTKYGKPKFASFFRIRKDL